MNYDVLENDSILIVPSQIKEKILTEMDKKSKLFNVKLMEINEFKRKYFFDYTTETIFYVMKHYNYDYEFSLDIINNLYFLSSEIYDHEKLKFLLNIKNELINNNLLIFDNVFKIALENKKIYVYGYDYINNFYKKMFSTLNVNYIDQNISKFNHDIMEFDTIQDEVIFVANKICELIENKIDLNKIKIINPSSDYNATIKRIFNLFNLPFYFNNNYLISTKISNNFFEILSNDIVETLEKLKETISLNDELEQTEYNQIVKICNKYNWCSNFLNIKNNLIYEFSNTKIDIKKEANYIEFVSLENNFFYDDEYVFLIGFNQNTYPKTVKDDDFLNDEVKKFLSLETTTEINKINYNILVNKLYSIKNLFISYKLKSPFNSFYRSQIIDDLNLNVVKNYNCNIHYSVLNDKLNLATILDNYLKYGEESQDLELLYSNYPSINYKTYNNQYTKIDENLFRKYLNNKLSLSYSSINNFYKCSFRYYMENILNLQISSNEFSLFIGNLFHYILSIMYNEDFNFSDSFETYVNENYEFNTYKERFFINKLKKELEFIIDNIKEQDKFTSFDSHKFEQLIKIDLSKDNYDITFKGIIDKISYKKEAGNTLISIIDYKTGNPNLNLNNIIYGIDMQLCIYAYLSSKLKLFANPLLVGIYLQKILNNEININKNKQYITMKQENLKLQGYSNSNESILKVFDNTYTDSKLIKGMKVSSKGFYAYSKVFDQAMLNSILNIVENNIDEARDKILNREFYINPKKIGVKNLIGCENCTYKELCFMTEDNIINLKEYKNLEFLKDDVNEMD